MIVPRPHLSAGQEERRRKSISYLSRQETTVKLTVLRSPIPSSQIAAKRVQVILKGTLLRRNKESQIDGKVRLFSLSLFWSTVRSRRELTSVSAFLSKQPLLNLGPKTITLEKLEFTADERETYTQVE